MTTDEWDEQVIADMRELMLFLCGEGPMAGLHFGEANPAIRGNFWWRTRFVRPRMERAIASIQRRRREAAPGGGLTQEQREAMTLGVRALHRDINFAYEMANHWYQKGPFSSVDKGSAARDYAKRCESAIGLLRALASPPSNGDANE